MDLPRFYDPNRIGTLFYPEIGRIAEEAAKARLKPASTDDQKVHLLIIDMQSDFCHENGPLYVPGAPADVRRLIEFIYRWAEHITSISCSLDSHLPFQIFHPAWWVDGEGNPPPPFTVITRADIEEGKWRAVRKPDWSSGYVKKLQEGSKKDLVIWPYHGPIGGVGHALDGELWSAVFWHALARRSQPTWWLKGSVAETEHYSVVQPEIIAPDQPEAGKNESLLELLRGQDRIYIAGEASSHCLLETIEDLLEEFEGEPEILGRIHVLRDCTSPVQHPEIDFRAITQARFAEFEQQGVHFVLSTDAALWLGANN